MNTYYLICVRVNRSISRFNSALFSLFLYRQNIDFRISTLYSLQDDFENLGFPLLNPRSKGLAKGHLLIGQKG